MRLSFVLSLLLCVSASAAGLSTRLSEIDATKFPQIGVLLGVFSEAGQPVPGLTKDDFAVAEDGTKLTVLSVEVEKTPLNIALVLDISGSMQPSMASLKAGVKDFLRDLDPSDRVTLLTFSDKVSLREELTTNRKGLIDLVERLEPYGATALWDAAQEGVLTLKNVQGRRLAVIFTDGKDQNEANTGPQSAHTVKDVAKMSRRQHVPLWTIGLGKEPDANLLGRLSAVTGGQFYNPSDAGDLRKTFGDVLTDVRLQYRVTYGTPKEKRDGSRRIVAVTSAAKGQSGQGRIAYLAPSESVARQTPVPAAPSGEASSRPVARVQQTPSADSTELGELLDETSAAAGAGLTVNGPGGAVDVGIGNVNVNGPRGTVNVSPGNVNITGPRGNLNVNASGGALNVTGSHGNVNVSPGNANVTGPHGSVDIGAGGIHVDGNGTPGVNVTPGSVDVGGIHIQTGPGGVSVDTPDASVNTGPGGVDVHEKQTQPESGSNEEPEQKE